VAAGERSESKAFFAATSAAYCCLSTLRRIIGGAGMAGFAAV
jgi:hypothetical protein